MVRFLGCDPGQNCFSTSHHLGFQHSTRRYFDYSRNYIASRRRFMGAVGMEGLFCFGKAAHNRDDFIDGGGCNCFC